MPTDITPFYIFHSEEIVNQDFYVLKETFDAV